MSQINTNTIKGVEDNDDVVFKTNNTTRITIASGGNVALPTTTATSLSAPTLSAINTAKAWVNWNGSTDAIKSSYNISSVADGGTGIYTVTYAQPMLENDYVIMGTVLASSKGNLSVAEMTSAACVVNAREAHSDTLTNYGADGIVVYAKQ